MLKQSRLHHQMSPVTLLSISLKTQSTKLPSSKLAHPSLIQQGLHSGPGPAELAKQCEETLIDVYYTKSPLENGESGLMLSKVFYSDSTLCLMNDRLCERCKG